MNAEQAFHTGLVWRLTEAATLLDETRAVATEIAAQPPNALRATTRQLQQQADDIFGEETYYAKVDITMPEPAKRKWEKRNGDGGE